MHIEIKTTKIEVTVTSLPNMLLAKVGRTDVHFESCYASNLSTKAM